MKKYITFMLALSMLVSILVLPAFAAEEADIQPRASYVDCEECGVPMITRTKTTTKNVTTACDNHSTNHTHTRTTVTIYGTCSNCGYYLNIQRNTESCKYPN